MNALNVFTKNKLNLTRLQSKPLKFIDKKRKVEFQADFDGDVANPNVSKAISDLRKVAHNVKIAETPVVPWFPTNINDFD
jgi:prephenate dehydratase